MEDRVEGEREGENKGRSPCSPLLSTPPRKRFLSAFDSCPSLPSKKKKRDLPDLSNCHSCGLRFSFKARSGKLQTLDSQWRIVLLCEECLHRIQSAAVCSYCFSEISTKDQSFLDCRQCSCRVHVNCIPKQRGYVAPSELDPDLFTCVDCCALPRSRIRRSIPSGFGDPLSSTVSMVSLEDLVRDAKKKASVAARAKENALEKAAAARRAAEVARNALDAVLTSTRPIPRPDSVVPDEELALQLHRAMNGSRRILRGGQMCSDRAGDLKRVQNTCKKVEACTEDKIFFETRDWNSSIELDSAETKEDENEIDRDSESNPVVMPVKEEQGSCSDKVVDSSGEDSSIGFELIFHDSSESQQKSVSDSPDRFVKKYSKRKSGLKGMINRKENQLMSRWQMTCSKQSTFSDATCQSPGVPVHSSPFSSIAKCKS